MKMLFMGGPRDLQVIDLEPEYRTGNLASHYTVENTQGEREPGGRWQRIHYLLTWVRYSPKHVEAIYAYNMTQELELRTIKELRRLNNMPEIT